MTQIRKHYSAVDPHEHGNATPRKSIYLDGMILEGAEDNPILLSYVGAYNDYLKSLPVKYPCPYPHPFTNYQDVTGLYRIEYKRIDTATGMKAEPYALPIQADKSSFKLERLHNENDFQFKMRKDRFEMAQNCDCKICKAILSEYLNEEIVQADKQEGEKEMIVKAKNILDGFTEEQRLVVFSFYCNHCGSTNPSCQCWNDD